MAWRLNKGDWSEAYVFLKLLAEGRIYSGDEDLNKVLSVYMDVLKIIRKNLGVKNEYAINTDYIVAFEGREDSVLIPISEVSGYAERLFEYIRMAKGSKAFEFPDIEDYLIKTMGIHNIKESCVDDEYDKKTDILLEVLNSNDSSREVIGFSVKSHLGNPPTLFNYSQASKMVYRVEGCDEETMHYINSMKNSVGGCDLDARIDYIKLSEKLDLKFMGSKIIDNRRYGEAKETGPFFTWNLEHYDVNMLSVFDAMLLSDYKEYIKCSAYKFKKECDINLFMTKMGKVSVENDIVTAHYNNDYFNEEEWCCVIYEFKNAGKTDIRCVSPVCTYKKDTMLCDVSNAKMILEYGWLSYSTMFDRKIRVGESFTTKICYHKDCIVSGMMSSIMFMCLEDCNNRFWNQPLFAPNNKIYDSYEITYKEYKDEYLPDSAIECFKKPWLW